MFFIQTKGCCASKNMLTKNEANNLYISQKNSREGLKVLICLKLDISRFESVFHINLSECVLAY